jgi:hypothetical protein
MWSKYKRMMSEWANNTHPSWPAGVVGWVSVFALIIFALALIIFTILWPIPFLFVDLLIVAIAFVVAFNAYEG